MKEHDEESLNNTISILDLEGKEHREKEKLEGERLGREDEENKYRVATFLFRFEPEWHELIFRKPLCGLD